MNKVYFDDYYDLAEIIYERAQEDGADIDVVGDYDMISQVLKNLVYADDADAYEFFNIELENEEVTGYDGPHVLTVESDGKVWCQKALTSKGEFLRFEADMIFVQEDYLKNVLAASINDDAEFYVISTGGKDEDFNRNEGDFKLLKDQDNKPCGFEYDDEGDGYCCHLRYCSCDSKKLEEILGMYKDITDHLSKWF